MLVLEFLMGQEIVLIFLLLFGDFVVLTLMLVTRTLLLATFFCTGWLPLGTPTDKQVQGQTLSVIFCLLIL